MRREGRPNGAALECPAKATAPILSAALRYANAGIPVFPCWPGTKNPLTPHGFKDATTNEAVIRGWWRCWPNANVAIATGSPGFDVLDVDVRATGTGQAALDSLRVRGLLAGALGIVRTPSGGLHIYFPGTDQRCGRLPAHFIDFKARGGYVLAPPSVIPGEGGYVWHFDLLGTGQPFRWADATAHLAPKRSPVAPRRSQRAPHTTASGQGIAVLANYVATASEGNRNGTLFWAACEALRSGYDDLSPLRQAGLEAGLDHGEVDRTIASATQRQRDGRL